VNGCSPLIVDVSPRDGLQNDSTVLAPAVRAQLCRRLAASGVERIEAVSFVNDRRVPAMAGAEEVVSLLRELADDRLVGLVLNMRGLERARACGLRRVNLALAATESFSLQNQGASRADAERFIAAAAAAARTAGISFVVTVSVCFGCPFEGRVAHRSVLELVERLAPLGPEAIVLADTIGVAAPRAVRELTRGALGCGAKIGGHFHDTRGTGVANSLAALEAGATVLDASTGGVGGCPFAPGATGNVATEDVVYALEECGVDTGIDLDQLIACARWLAGRLGHPVPGAVARAGGFPRPLGAIVRAPEAEAKEARRTSAARPAATRATGPVERGD
jgi:isopropylmalate/homocitrate/citramalate synthase